MASELPARRNPYSIGVGLGGRPRWPNGRVQILTGLAMSPGIDAAFHWVLPLFGGRQSARTIHFVSAHLLVAFLVVHVVMVVLSGFWNNMRSMVKGWFVIEKETLDEHPSA
jgi:hypothetical protein